MKLKALDQVHVSAVQPDSLRPGQHFEVGDDLGAQLLDRHPGKFELLPDDEAPAPDAEQAAPAPEEKAAPAPKNKAAAKPKNKAAAG